VEGDDRVSRYVNSTLANAWTCQDGMGETVQCTVTGRNDPPMDLIDSHLQWFSNVFVGNETKNPLVLFLGDTLTHKTSSSNPVYSWVDTVSLITEKALASLSDVTTPESIFYVNGNNDGE
jgi:hypothetical protein